MAVLAYGRDDFALGVIRSALGTHQRPCGHVHQPDVLLPIEATYRGDGRTVGVDNPGVGSTDARADRQVHRQNLSFGDGLCIIQARELSDAEDPVVVDDGDSRFRPRLSRRVADASAAATPNSS